MSGWIESDVAAEGLGIHYHRTGGEQQSVVLVHGFSDNGLCWRRVARALEASFDVVMVDARNHGRSSTAVGDVHAMASDLATTIDALELDRPAIVGHSIGAAVAAQIAVDHPALVSRLVLEDPPWRDGPDPDAARRQRRADAREHLASFATMTDGEIRQLGDRQHPGWDGTDMADWVVAKRQVRVEAAESIGLSTQPDLVDRLQCPTLVIHGEPARGGIVTPDLAARLAAHCNLISACAIDGTGHNIRRENFERYRDVLGEFLTAGPSVSSSPSGPLPGVSSVT